MKKQIPGIHHVTAIASNPQQNIDFYTGFLGLRMVKLTVNFDDPESYHLYYGDSSGNPGTILTFFAWPGAPRGRRGVGQATTTSFSIPANSVDYWIDRFGEHDIAFQGPELRFDEEVLTFSDPDGLQLELVAHANTPELRPWSEGSVPPEYAPRGFRGVTLSEVTLGGTEPLLTEVMGFRRMGEDKGRIRFEAEGEAAGRIVELLPEPGWLPGRVAVGTIHHVAWRARDDDDQQEWREEIGNVGLSVTQVMDRKYFRSIYFREPGGVLFEIATDPPGFTVDEPVEGLGSDLMLPSWMEPNRAQIERRLPPLVPIRRAA
jgi:glyoxalase family protein